MGMVRVTHTYAHAHTHSHTHAHARAAATDLRVTDRTLRPLYYNICRTLRPLYYNICKHMRARAHTHSAQLQPIYVLRTVGVVAIHTFQTKVIVSDFETNFMLSFIKQKHFFLQNVQSISERTTADAVWSWSSKKALSKSVLSNR